MSMLNPGLSLRSNPGLELANAFGVRPTDLAELDLHAAETAPSTFGSATTRFSNWLYALSVMANLLSQLDQRCTSAALIGWGG